MTAWTCEPQCGPDRNAACVHCALDAEREENARLRSLFNDAAELAAVRGVALAERHALPVLRTCGDCAHYADVRDGQCEHPFQRPFPETGRNDVPPAWCPLRRLT